MFKASINCSWFLLRHIIWVTGILVTYKSDNEITIICRPHVEEIAIESCYVIFGQRFKLLLMCLRVWISRLVHVLAKSACYFVMSVCLRTSISLAPTAYIFVKFDIATFIKIYREALNLVTFGQRYQELDVLGLLLLATQNRHKGLSWSVMV